MLLSTGSQRHPAQPLKDRVRALARDLELFAGSSNR